MSRIFENTKEALNEIERDIMEMGIMVHPHTMQNKDVKDNDDYSTKEVQNYSFTILDADDAGAQVPSIEWASAEFMERISAIEINPGTAWELRADVWKEFLDKNGQFDYTYNQRLNDWDQINKVIKELKVNPDTRQAIVHVHRPSDINSMRKLRMPCSMYYQFMVRRGKLDVIYNMRSSDYDTHFRNDIYLAHSLRNYIANLVNIPVGLLHMNIGSLHRYKNYTTKHVF